MTSGCPCDKFIYPVPIFNRPGLTTVRYRIGDFLAFREALLRPLDAEVELKLWRPGATGDLAVQIVEWWAYLADILTFYDERIANQYYLRTADLPESLQGIIRLLGYRPRPGIGASGVVAALIKGPKPVLIPAGYQIQSKPGPGQTPQTFEVDRAVTATLPDAAPVDAPPVNSVGASLLLQGQDAAIQPGDQLLVLNQGWAAKSGDYYEIATVAGVAQEKDPRGKKNTRVTFTSALNSGSFHATDLQVLRSAESVGVWPYPANGVVTANQVHLASIVRGVQAGDPIVFDVRISPRYLAAVSVTGNAETVWYANAPDAAKPDVGPDPNNSIPIPILHTYLGFSGSITASTPDGNRSVTRIRYNWKPAGTVIATPSASASGPALTVTPVASALPALTAGQQVLLADGVGDGSVATVAGEASGTQLPLIGIDPAAALRAPLQLLLNVLSVSRGKTVPSEILGSGDATQAGQEFELKKSPLTYLQSSDPESSQAYISTLRVWVGNIQWTEVPSFYGQSPTAQVFVTREDTDNKTHVLFGDGVQGARLPSGVNNVIASYRYESGAALPATGSLTVLTKPLPGLKSMVNPVQPFGGADPDPPQRIRTLAPKSVLSFNRAVSGADYEVIAAAAPGVARARAYWAFDALRQQTVVTVFVGDSSGAVAAAQKALARTVDPNKPFVVQQASAVPMHLFFTLVIAPKFQQPEVTAAVQAALLDPDAGLLGINTVRIGQTVFHSQICEACLRVPGVQAVHNLFFWPKSFSFSFFSFFLFLLAQYRYFAGEGKFFQLDPADLTINVEAGNAV